MPMPKKGAVNNLFHKNALYENIPRENENYTYIYTKYTQNNKIHENYPFYPFTNDC